MEEIKFIVAMEPNRVGVEQKRLLMDAGIIILETAYPSGVRIFDLLNQKEILPLNPTLSDPLRTPTT